MVFFRATTWRRCAASGRSRLVKRGFDRGALIYIEGKSLLTKGDTIAVADQKLKAGSNVLTLSSTQKVTNGNIYFNDSEYGKINILASDKGIPCGSIVKITNSSLGVEVDECRFR